MFVVEATYDGGPYMRGKEDQRWECETVEEAAQRFESEAGVPSNWPLAQIVEDLATEGKVEYDNTETCWRVVAFEAVGAVV